MRGRHVVPAPISSPRDTRERRSSERRSPFLQSRRRRATSTRADDPRRSVRAADLIGPDPSARFRILSSTRCVGAPKTPSATNERAGPAAGQDRPTREEEGAFPREQQPGTCRARPMRAARGRCPRNSPSGRESENAAPRIGERRVILDPVAARGAYAVSATASGPAAAGALRRSDGTEPWPGGSATRSPRAASPLRATRRPRPWSRRSPSCTARATS